jgi:hypothetical protein
MMTVTRSNTRNGLSIYQWDDVTGLQQQQQQQQQQQRRQRWE